MPEIRLTWAVTTPDDPLAAWRHVPRTSTHHLVLGASALEALGPAGLAAARSAATAVPEAALAFAAKPGSCQAAAVRIAALSGHRWAPATHERAPMTAMVLPAQAASGFTAFAADGGEPQASGVLMSRYLRALGMPTYFAVPPWSVGGPDPPVQCTWELADGLATLDAVPFLRHGRALVATRTGDGWETISADRYLSRLGCNPKRYRTRLRTLLAKAGGPLVEPAAYAGPDSPTAPWQTVLLMGMVNGGRGCDPQVPEHRLWALGEVLNNRQEEIRGLVRVAYSTGVAAGSRLRPAPTGGGPARRRRPLRIAVTGADQPLAVPLANRLADLGWEVAALARSPTGPGYPGVTERLVDPAVRGALQGEFRGLTAIVHVLPPDNSLDCAPAIGRLWGQLQNILHHAGQAGVRQLVCLGGPLAVNHAHHVVLQPDAQEAAVTVLRLSPVYGPGLPGTPIAGDRTSGRAMSEQHGDGTTYPVYVGDVADAVDRSLRNPSAVGLFDIQGLGRGARDGLLDRAGAELGWEPVTSLQAGTRRFSEWLVHDTRDALPPEAPDDDRTADCPCAHLDGPPLPPDSGEGLAENQCRGTAGIRAAGPGAGPADVPPRN
ncbi:hypothetical protein AB0K43_30785 [Kitasatospora sp. NPDC049258]|uniref:NAD-dependent epimerase/dehydratase family protein n=1 Tax=Kitasatospora sp. NPDC049258 TaxID=3155394 RepID=UPI00342A6C13